jgi:hypothetical protein
VSAGLPGWPGDLARRWHDLCVPKPVRTDRNGRWWTYAQVDSSLCMGTYRPDRNATRVDAGWAGIRSSNGRSDSRRLGWETLAAGEVAVSRSQVSRDRGTRRGGLLTPCLQTVRRPVVGTAELAPGGSGAASADRFRPHCVARVWPEAGALDLSLDPRDLARTGARHLERSAGRCGGGPGRQRGVGKLPLGGVVSTGEALDPVSRRSRRGSPIGRVPRRRRGLLCRR